MKNLLTLIIEKFNVEDFSRIYINAANCAEQLKFYVNIEDMDMFELDDLIETFFRIRRNKRAKSELIVYSLTPLGEDLISTFDKKRIEYFYCGELSNYALTILSNLKHINGFTPVVAIDASAEKWFDYALWAIQYNNRIFFYNMQDVEPNLLIAFLMHEKIDENNIVNYKTIEYLIEKQVSVPEDISNSLLYINDQNIYDYNHKILGNFSEDSLSTILPQKEEENILLANCENCNLKNMCKNFNVGIIDISSIKNCELLKKIVSLIMINKDRKEYNDNVKY